MLLLCSDETGRPGAAQEAAMAGCGGWDEEMRKCGVLQAAAGLQPSTDATTVRVRGDEVLLADGPFAETKDQMGGFSLIECADLDEAIEVVSRHPWAEVGQIEIRPVWEG
ncbi:YciI family protein [Actinomadura scrupuli]|uniref:YciI family protein n=1 Tax=Actinomadura scrupuli TaxID=559629 RepID=UPI003D97A066